MKSLALLALALSPGSIEPAWVARYDAVLSRADDAVDLAVDGAGNVITVGVGTNVAGQSFVVVKHDPYGRELWAREFPADGRPADVEVDAAGNVYVTGTATDVRDRVGNDSDVLTLKFDPHGVLLFAEFYDGPAGGLDAGRALAVDGAGNAVVAGYSREVGGAWGVDFVALKYGPSGHRVWAVEWDSAGGADDYAADIALDAAGNVFVTGWSAVDNASASMDYVTSRLDADGGLAWVRSYDGPDGAQDYAVAVAVDAVGDVVVTGASTEVGKLDYATLKYDAAGSALWTARHGTASWSVSGDSRPAALTVDAAGNVFVTGSSYRGVGSFEDYATVKYDASGAEQWVRHHVTAERDEAVDVVADPSGNVFVTGSSGGDLATVAYDGSGNELWLAVFDGGSYDEARAVALDGSGRAIVAGTSDGGATSDDLATVAYGPGGTPDWIARHDGRSSATDDAVDNAVDELGQVYVAGLATVYQGVTHASLVGLDAGGRRVFEHLEAGVTPDDLAPYPGGGVVLAGSVDEGVTSGERDLLVVRYAPDGSELWRVTHGTPGSDESAAAVAVDTRGDVYVTGTTAVSYWDLDYVTLKLDSNGNLLWVATQDGGTGGRDVAVDVAVDARGDAFVTGTANGTFGAVGGDILTLRYDPSGTVRWSALHDGGGSGADAAVALAVDGSGRVYVTGLADWQSNYFFSSSDIATLAYDTRGNLEWAATYDSEPDVPWPSYDAPEALAVDSSGNVFVVGSSARGWTAIQYDARGSERWVRTPRPWGVAEALAVDGAGGVYVGGSWNGSIVTARYDAAGEETWLARYGGPAAPARSAALALDGAGGVLVTGSADAEKAGNRDLVTLRYAP